MNKISKKAFKPIDQEEKNLMASIEQDDWKPVKDFHAEKEKAISGVHPKSCTDHSAVIRVS